jgi:hypothetical protein
LLKLCAKLNGPSVSLDWCKQNMNIS